VNLHEPFVFQNSDANLITGRIDDDFAHLMFLVYSVEGEAESGKNSMPAETAGSRSKLFHSVALDVQRNVTGARASRRDSVGNSSCIRDRTHVV
jgi:hypothetical protein